MGIITISRGSYTRAKEIAEKTAQALGYNCISREGIISAFEDFDIPEIKLMHAVDDAPSFLDRFAYGKERYIAYIRAALLNQLRKDNVVYHGFVYHFFVKDIPKVLNVRIISGIEDRMKIVMERDNISRKEALRLVKKVDSQRKKWGRTLYGIDPENPGLYDLVLNIEKVTVDDAAAAICRISQLDQFQTTPESKKATQDLALAAEVKTFLIGVRTSVDVCLQDGMVILKTETPLPPESPLEGKMGQIMKVPGVKGIRIVTEEDSDDKYVCITDPGPKSIKETLSTYLTDLG